jgi:uroporphyrin-III C-methyltransferase/precorrin-2 dehydrogenase/sirohydrochlorin ferrochelatase
MDHLPIFLNVKGTRSLVVGGDFLAARKADLLLRAGCKLTVLAPTLGEELTHLAQTQDFEHKMGELSAEDLAGCKVVFGCSRDQAINRKLCDLAEAAGILVNITDDPGSCDFIMPAIVDRSPLLVAIASSGTSPLLTRMLRARFETDIPAAYGRLAEFAGSYRDRIKKSIPNGTRRRRFWETMIAGPVAEHIFSGQIEQAQSLMENLLDEAARDGDKQPIGEVYLVGTGPGDPDLLTFRALRLMQQADVVLYDRLIGEGILNLVRRDAQRIYVGKLPKNHTVPQEEIGKMLIRLAQEGKRVLRLNGRWLRSLCRYTADSPRPCPGLHLCHRARKGWRTQSELEQPDPAPPDRRGLHGAFFPRGDYQRLHHAWRRSGNAGSNHRERHP